MWKEFKEFIARGSVIDLAVGVMVGAAFSKIVASLVEGVLTPPIGVILSKVDFSNLFYDLSGQRHASLTEAKTKGLPVIAYGMFINDVAHFLIIAFVIFMLVRLINRLKSEQEAAMGEPTTKDCPYCLSTTPRKATRCAHCIAELQGSEA